MFAFWRMDLISAALQQKSPAMPTLFKVQALLGLSGLKQSIKKVEDFRKKN